MSVFKCPNCNTILIDPELYFKPEGEKKHGLQTIIECPKCKYKDKLKNFNQ